MFRIRLQGQWTSSSRDVLTRKDAGATGASATKKGSGTCGSTSEETDESVETIEKGLITMEELLFEQVNMV